MPGKVHGRIPSERLMQVTEKEVSDEQGGFRKEKSCMEKIFAVETLVEDCFFK